MGATGLSDLCCGSQRLRVDHDGGVASGLGSGRCYETVDGGQMFQQEPLAVADLELRERAGVDVGLHLLGHHGAIEFR